MAFSIAIQAMLPDVFGHRVGRLVADGLACRQDAPQLRRAEIDARAGNRHHRAGCHCIREPFSQYDNSIVRPAGPLDDRQATQLEDAIGFLPAVELVKHVGTDDEIEFCVFRVGGSQFPEGVHRVGSAAALNLTVRHAEVGVVGYRQLHHAQAVGRRGDPLPRLEPGFAGRHEQNRLQFQRDASGFGDQQVSQMRRVECAAQDPDASIRLALLGH